MLEAKWIFEPVGPMGGATGNAFVNTLQGSGLAPAAELAREAIQNSCDAAKEGERRVRVVFRIENLEGEVRRRFLQDSQLERTFSARVRSIRVAPDNCLAERSRPLTLVYVEDYGTVGLNGDPHSRKSHFHRLLLSVGDSTKAHSGTGTGGSFGYGKSALSLNSRLRTIFAYSVFERDETGATARLMGCAYFDAHEFDGKQWTGRAWFGVRRPDGELVVDPLRDEDAHALAERLGFRRRGADEHGTSILIVDSDLHDQSPLLRAIEEWWWPRLVDQELEVKVQAPGGPYFPQPKQRRDLAPYIESYSLALRRSEPLGPHQKRERFNRMKGLELGDYALQLLAEDQIELVPEDKLGCIALIRSPKMVVQYAQVGRTSPAAVGAFVAHSDIDEILKLSEPPNHDRWDPDSRRLEVAQPDEATARRVVKTVAKRLKDQMRKFQAQATPPKPPEERRLRFLERELAGLFRPNVHDGDRREGETEPVEIRFREGPVARASWEGRIETFAKVALRLSEKAEDDRAEAVVRVRVPVLKDERGSEDELLALTIECDQLKAPVQGTEPDFEVSLTKDQWVVFSSRTEPYDPAWSVKIDVEVLSPEAVQ